jgi:hypothetical protein
MVDQKILDRIKKLLAMSQDMSSEHEAAIATRRLHALLAQYNLSMTDLEHDKEDIKSDSFYEEDRTWKRVIANGIAQLYFCHLYTDKYLEHIKRRHASYVVTGSGPNRVVAINIIQRTIEAIKREAREGSYKSYGEKSTPYMNSFKNAAGNRIYERCMQLIEQARKGTLKGDDGDNLPVLASVYDQAVAKIDEFLKSEGLNLKQRETRQRSSDMLGSLHGRVSGDKQSLNTSLHSQVAPKLLK